MELIERAEFLAIMQDQLDKVQLGEGRCVFIYGEAGIGKTSFVKTFCKEQNHCIVYQGACDALFTPRPLAPLYDIILQVRSELWSSSHTIEERSALFLKFFQEISSKKEKIIIVFEDIHWADEATLDFIKFFARRITHLRCLFVLTYRDDEISSHHPLRKVIGALSPDTFIRIALAPLSRQAVYKLATEKGFDAENVYNISAGNPFYVNEILASYSPGVPENIKDAILSVYEQQQQGTKEAWQICSVIPEGLELHRFAKLKAILDKGMDHCFDLKIIVIKNQKIVFKHELYRRTIETSLSPFKRIELNKKLLDLFLNSFEENGEIERIVHYAKNANDNDIVVKYAPLAATQAASVGAHIEAAKLFLTAIQYSEGNNPDQLVQFYEAYAYESYLTNQIKEAIIYQGKALKVWEQKNGIEKIASSLRFLSRLWWFDGSREKAETYALQAIDILKSQPPSKTMAMAYSNMSQLKMFSEETNECVAWGNKAIEMARELEDSETLSHALSNVGASLWRIQPSNDTAKQQLMDALDIALKNSFHEHAGRAYSNIISNYIAFKDFESAARFLRDGIAYCEERDLDSSKNYKLYQKSRMLLEMGDWDESLTIVKTLLSNPAQPIIIKIGALTTLCTIEVRKGVSDGMMHLQEVRSHVIRTKEHHQIIPAIISCLEYEWLTLEKIITEEELHLCLRLVKNVDSIILNCQFQFWLRKARSNRIILNHVYEPYKLLEAGNIKQAASFWRRIHCPFEEALALAEGNDEDKKTALQILQHLGADAFSERLKMEMRTLGIKNIPRGIRESTKANPAQLTNREIDVLQLLQKGLQNKKIASTLFISTKTAENHISNILFKLDVTSRSSAVTEALRLSILK